MDHTADILAIRALADRYSDAANRLDIPGMASVYTEDAVLISFGNRFEGRAAIEAVFAQSMQMAFMNQICSGAVIEVAGDTATARWTVTEFCKRLDLDQLEMFMGSYDDQLVRTADGWRFSQRILSRRAQARWDAKIRI